jgi:uncharacterized protein YbjT (DUF2867 family)
MILIAGGTGRLGREVVRLLTSRDIPVRILTRDPARAESLRSDLVQVVSGDVRDPAAVEQATVGVETVVSAIHGFAGTGDDTPKSVDLEGNKNLIAAARAGGAEHVVLLSIHGAAPDHPMELFRMKHLAEAEVKKSGLAWTIIRPTAYMETWLELIGEPLIKTGKTRIFGRGANPINFVSVRDVALVVERAVVDSSLRGAVLEVGGPENLTMRQVAEAVQEVSGRTGSVSQVPLPLMRLMAVLMRPLNKTVARQIQAGVVMDTRDMSFAQADAAPWHASRPPTHMADVIGRDYGSRIHR